MSQPSFDSTDETVTTTTTTTVTTSAVSAAKQSLNVYTVMLLVSFIALLAGAILLLVELRRWGNFPAETPWDTSSVGAWVSEQPYELM
jgi:hypothetical protein